MAEIVSRRSNNHAIELSALSRSRSKRIPTALRRARLSHDVVCVVFTPKSELTGHTRVRAV